MRLEGREGNEKGLSFPISEYYMPVILNFPRTPLRSTTGSVTVIDNPPAP